MASAKRAGYRWLAAGCLLPSLSACGTFLSHDGPRADAPRIYSGVRLDWATWQRDQNYIDRYRLQQPAYPLADLPLSFALDSLLLPLCIYRSIYQGLAVPPGGW